MKKALSEKKKQIIDNLPPENVKLTDLSGVITPENVQDISDTPLV